jgi:hypothetical protein
VVIVVEIVFASAFCRSAMMPPHRSFANVFSFKSGLLPIAIVCISPKSPALDFLHEPASYTFYGKNLE